MNLRELNPPLIELPAGQTFFRVQLLRARRDSAKVGALVLAPPGALRTAGWRLRWCPRW